MLTVPTVSTKVPDMHISISHFNVGSQHCMHFDSLRQSLTLCHLLHLALIGYAWSLCSLQVTEDFVSAAYRLLHLWQHVPLLSLCGAERGGRTGEAA